MTRHSHRRGTIANVTQPAQADFYFDEFKVELDAKKDKTKRMFFLQQVYKVINLFWYNDNTRVIPPSRCLSAHLNQEQLSERNKSVSIRKGQQFRESFTVYLPGASITDKLTTLDCVMRYSLKQGKEDELPFSPKTALISFITGM